MKRGQIYACAAPKPQTCQGTAFARVMLAPHPLRKEQEGNLVKLGEAEVHPQG